MTEPADQGNVADRVYGGRSAPQRRADRRERLIEAGMDLMGTVGYEQASIERLCLRAGVSTRYFYEEFASREELLVAVYEQLLAAATRICLEAVRAYEDLHPDPISRTEQIDCGLRSYVGYLVEDARRVRILHLEMRTVPALEAFRAVTMRGFAEQIRQSFRGSAPLSAESGRVLSLALLGAVGEVLGGWAGQPEPRMPVGELIDELSSFCTSALDALIPLE
ncbi:MAG: transcriptional regulator [Frankiales bacterium]|nr:transcriptional regulator [Frankiales bacterium]